MKEGIHPKYVAAKVTCTCGNTFETRSTIPEIRVEICSACHPFFTGRKKIVDTEGRVEKFMQRYRKGKEAEQAQEPVAEQPEKPAAQAKQAAKGAKKPAKRAKKSAKKPKEAEQPAQQAEKPSEPAEESAKDAQGQPAAEKG